ncbi:MAG: ribbon-helix-helix domain-containing protein [bacterium]|nr:ribbon-helix-helix domain-containing protein [bacterium]
MRTVSISVPDKLAQEVDTLTEKGSYASRSEVMREALRFFLEIERTSSTPSLERFSKIPLEKVGVGLAKAGHSPRLVKDVLAGLKKSSLYR